MPKVNDAGPPERRAFSLARVQLLLAILVISLGSRALAQSAPPAPNNPSQPLFYPAPSVEFDPIGATDAQLAAYGFPPRPALMSNGYATWANAVTKAKTRIANPVAQSTNRSHPPAMRGNSVSLAGATANASIYSSDSTNWSGLVATGVYGYFMSDGSSVTTNFQVPSIGNENCPYEPYTAALWAGMDGFFAGDGSGDVLQAGIVANACPTDYKAFYSWFTNDCQHDSPSQPCYEQDVNIPVNQGDWMYIVVTYRTSSPHGSAFISNQSTGQYISVSFDEADTKLSPPYAGRSAEWVVERELFQGNYLSNLANYHNTNGPSGNQQYLYAAYGDGVTNWAAGYGPENSLYLVNMYCAPWNGPWHPTSACPSFQYISLATFYNNVLLTQAAGPAVQ